MSLEFGLLIPSTPRPNNPLEKMLPANTELLQYAADNDLTAWFVDHFQVGELPYLECFAQLAHSAGRHPGLRLGTLVLGVGYRNPALVAKISASLDFLTGGKFILGMGAGWKEDEYRAYGFPFPSTGARIEQLEESLQLIKAMWTDKPANYQGKHFTVTNAFCEPRPTPHPILMVGGGGEKKTLRIAAQYADWWNVDYISPEAFSKKLEILHRHCNDLGRDPATITPSYYGVASISRDPAKVHRAPPPNFPPTAHIFGGSPEEVTEQLKAFERTGVQHFQMLFLDYPNPEGRDLFINEVLPHFPKAVV
jgi:alkanesulfonate monooxygenase SsuD/methylene tetrahydromethanopterin reductase-like flavin-dependent oxidoreductase (luciferase family)